MSENLQSALLAALADAMQPLVEAGSDPATLAALLQDSGWALEYGDPAAPGLIEDLSSFSDAVEDLVDAVALAPDSFEGLATAVAKAGAMYRALQELAPDLAKSGLSLQQAEELLGNLVAILVVRYLDYRWPAVFHVTRLLGIVELIGTNGSSSGTELRARLHLNRVPELLQQPIDTLRALYLTTEADSDRAEALAAVIFPLLEDLLGSMGVQAVTGLDPSQSLSLSEGALDVANRLLTVYLPADPGRAGLALGLGTGDAGIQLTAVPFGNLSLEFPATSWQATLVAGATAPGVAIDSAGVRLPSGHESGSLHFTLHVEPVSSREVVLLGGGTGTRLQCDDLAVMAAGQFSASTMDFRIAVKLSGTEFVVASDNGDGFLQQVLPEQLGSKFDLEIGYSLARGLFLGSGSGLDARLPVGYALGPILLKDIVISVEPGPQRVSVDATANITVNLGPAIAAVEGVGVVADLRVNSGDDPSQLPVSTEIRFKPPDGVGIAIDAGVVVGGGYLFFDVEKQQYAGVVHLELAETLGLTAVGLLTTRMPDGSPGFSLLVLIAATFSPPIQLGYGFTLNGVGGLIGVNRTVAVEPLRAGLRTGSLGSVLFPADPIRNAPQIISDLSAIFPPAPGRFLIGPMVQLGWGTPTLLTIELGLVLELPEPVRLLILGRLRVTLPTPDAPIIRLQLDSVGVVDFASGDVALDAVLYDSRVAGFTVTGDMALRANFGARPDMVLAIGGFNPRYQPPAGFPVLEPVTISLAAGDNPRLRLQAYLAVTTNTVQFGALLDLFAKAGPFSIAGLLGLDVLVQLAPFGFIADLGATLALKYNNKSVMSVGLQMTLSGPTPWHAWGTASYKVLFFSGSIDFDVRIGAAQKPALPPPVNIRPLLVAALSESGNWATELPRGEHPIVSLRDQIGRMDHFVHPLADLRVTQRVVPLGREISRFGAATPEAERIFGLGIVGADGNVRWTEAVGVRTVMEMFAPAQFRQMADDEKLTAPAFESMQAGIRFAPPGFVCGPAVVEPEIVYARETIHRAATAPAAVEGVSLRTTQFSPDEEELLAAPTRTLERSTVLVQKDVAVTTDFVQQVASIGAAAQVPISRTGDRRFESPADGVVLRAPAFAVVVGRGLHAMIPPPLEPDGKPEPGAEKRSYTTAVETLNSRLEKRQGARGRLHVVPVYEGEIE